MSKKVSIAFTELDRVAINPHGQAGAAYTIGLEGPKESIDKITAVLNGQAGYKSLSPAEYNAMMWLEMMKKHVVATGSIDVLDKG